MYALRNKTLADGTTYWPAAVSRVARKLLVGAPKGDQAFSTLRRAVQKYMGNTNSTLLRDPTCKPERKEQRQAESQLWQGKYKKWQASGKLPPGWEPAVLPGEEGDGGAGTDEEGQLGVLLSHAHHAVVAAAAAGQSWCACDHTLLCCLQQQSLTPPRYIHLVQLNAG